MKLLNFLLLGLLGLLHYHLWLGEKSWFDLDPLEQEVATLEQENRLLETRNRILKAEIEDLREGTAAMIENARSELGYVREDEYFIRLLPETENSSASAY